MGSKFKGANKDKGLRREHAIIAACRQGKVEHIISLHMYIKSKCGHSICLTYKYSNLLDPLRLFFGH